MPIAPTYPGVYIEEIPSGVRTITGVATSIAAFLGRALRGPVNDPITINSFGDFERTFGGLSADSSLGYAVRDFFLNGGAQAIVVRLYHPDASPKNKAAITVGNFKLEAASEGAWGNKLKATVDVDVTDAAATALGVTKADLFNLTLKDTNTAGITEVLRNLTVKDTPRRLDKVLKAESSLARWFGAWNTASPPAIAAGDDDPSKLVTATDGGLLTRADDFTPANAEADKKGLYALAKADLFNILCIPPYLTSGDVDAALVSDAAAYCEKRRAMLLLDPPSAWTTKKAAKDGIASPGVGTSSKNAALYFPRLKQPNPLRGNQVEDFAPCGAVAGVFARTDAQRGVWKAPAGLDATLVGVPELSVPLNDPENGELNPLGINCLRTMPAAGRVVWGTRTLQGDDRLASEWKYVPVRRLALFLEESLYRGTQWVVFEPNDEPLWAQIRLNIGAFMQNLFRQGAFQGKTPREAYFVKCDRETTTQTDINLGIVNIVVGFAPLKPAEFVIIKIQQMAGQIQV